jgi:hypothetical protein
MSHCATPKVELPHVKNAADWMQLDHHHGVVLPYSTVDLDCSPRDYDCGELLALAWTSTQNVTLVPITSAFAN